MQSLLKSCQVDKLNELMNHLVDFLDLSKLNRQTLNRICNPTKLSINEFLDILDESRLPISLMNRILFDRIKTDDFEISLNDLKKIEFKKFSEEVLQSCLMFMIFTKMCTDKICVLLDNLKSVNFGREYSYDYAKQATIDYGNSYFYQNNQKDIDLEKIYKFNPLIYCSKNGHFELVKLLIDKYNADIEHLSRNNTTAIMFSAQMGHDEITKLLYYKGAKLYTHQHDISQYAESSLRSKIFDWRFDKIKSQHKNQSDTQKNDFTDIQKCQRNSNNVESTPDKSGTAIADSHDNKSGTDKSSTVIADSVKTESSINQQIIEWFNLEPLNTESSINQQIIEWFNLEPLNVEQIMEKVPMVIIDNSINQPNIENIKPLNMQPIMEKSPSALCEQLKTESEPIMDKSALNKIDLAMLVKTDNIEFDSQNYEYIKSQILTIHEKFKKLELLLQSTNKQV